MASDRESPTPSADTKPKRQPPRPRNEPRQVAPPPPPPAPPAATSIVAGDLRRSDDARRGRTGPTTHHGAGGRAPTGPLGGDWGLMAKAPPPPPPSAREERVSPDFARPPGFRPDMADEGPRSERRQTAKPGGATADRHSRDQRSTPRGRFPAPKPQKAPKPLSGREFNDGLRKGGVDLDRPVTPDTLRQAVGERDYQRRRDPGLFAGVAAGFRSLFPGDVARDATGRMKDTKPRPGVTFRSVLDELGLGSLDAAERAGRRRATKSIFGGNGDDTLKGQSGDDKLLRNVEPQRRPPAPEPPEPGPDIPRDADGRPLKGVTAAEMQAFDEALRTMLPDMTPRERQAYWDIYNFEGGEDTDNSNQDYPVRSGISKDTIDRLLGYRDEKTGRWVPGKGSDFADPGTPSVDLSLDQRAEAYRDFMDDAFERIEYVTGLAGHQHIDAISDQYAARALVDTMFRHGRNRGVELAQRAIIDVVKNAELSERARQRFAQIAEKAKLTNLEDLKIDAGMGQQTYTVYDELAKDPATRNVLLDALAKRRKDDKRSPGDQVRAEYFRFEHLR